MTQSDDGQGKLYTRFVSALKLIQYFGYFVVVALSSLNAYSFFSASAAQGGVQPVAIFGIILQTAVTLIFVYVITQALIAIVDLLSRIERNTRGRAVSTTESE